MSLLSRIKAMFAVVTPEALPPPAPDIELTDDGFLFGARRIRWSVVRRIRTYKIELFSVDCICLWFDLDGEQPLEMTEESNGFNGFIDALLEAFPTIPPDWYGTVMQPPFERNEAVLFEK
jgi:hypothetical protein